MEQEIIYGKSQPQATDIEEAILGTLISVKDSYVEVGEILKEELFYKETNLIIFKAIKTLSIKGQPIDLHTVTNELKTSGNIDRIGGLTTIAEILSKAVYSSIVHLIRILQQKYLSRELITIGQKIISEAHSEQEDVLIQIETLQNTLFNLTNFDSNEVVTMRQNVANYLDYLADNAGKKITGIPTGFRDIDLHMKGLQNSNLIIVAGEPGQGKTSLAMNIATNVALFDYPVFIASYEMSVNELTERIITSTVEINKHDIIQDHLTDSDRLSFNRAIDEISESPIYIYDIKNNNINNLCSAIRKHKINHGIKLVVVDYLQLISGDNKKNREQEVGSNSRILKNLAKELDIPIILLSQLRREDDHWPTTQRLRDSGQIEESADIIIFVYRQEKYLEEKGYSDTYTDGTSVYGVAKIIFAKGRSIGEKIINMSYNEKITKFTNF